jgi:dolichol-phosphate mannosyltransferase
VEQTLSVIMPALNEENNIEAAINSTLDAFKKHNINGEIIVINDGSTDKTRNLVEEISKHNSRVSVIHHNYPKGIGYSFWEGVKHSTNDVVVMFPGDNENDSDNALEFFYLMQDVDIIVPFIHNIEVRDRFRRLISSIYRFIINMSFGINLNYTNGTVFYRREILDDIELKNYGFFYQAELLIKLIRKGYLFAEIPNYLSTRNSGKSKAVTLKSLFKVMNGYLQLVFDIHIKRIELGRNYGNLNKNSASYRKYIEFQEKNSFVKEGSHV